MEVVNYNNIVLEPQHKICFSTFSVHKYVKRHTNPLQWVERVNVQKLSIKCIAVE